MPGTEQEFQIIIINENLHETFHRSFSIQQAIGYVSLELITRPGLEIPESLQPRDGGRNIQR